MNSSRKKIKTWGLTGIFAASAAIPVVLISRYVLFRNSSSINNQNSESDNSQFITPKLKSSISLSGTIDKIYDSQKATVTNTLVAQEIHNNLDQVFENSQDLQKVNNLKIAVEGDFTNSSSWSGVDYEGDNGWKGLTKGNVILYSSKFGQLNISSLNDLKTQLDNDAKIKEIIREFDSSKLNQNAIYSIQNKPAVTNDNLLHVNVIAILGSNTKYFDLQIPTSSINLNISNMSISVSGNNVKPLTSAVASFNYNVSLAPKSYFMNPASTPVASASEVTNANKILVKLGLAEVTTRNQIVLTQKAIQEQLGIYNVEFSNASIAPSGTTTNGKSGLYQISLQATPIANGDFVWDDGQNTVRTITFEVWVNVGEITPTVNSTLNITGPFSKIFAANTGTGNNRVRTNDVIADDIKSNLSKYFSNGNDLKTVENLNIRVEGNFPETSVWTGEPYEVWSKTTRFKGIYSSSSQKINITSLNDLKTKLNSIGLGKFLLDSNLLFRDASFTILNQLGFTGGDLIHVNILVNSPYTQGTFTVDVGIPTSDINLIISNLKIASFGDNVTLQSVPVNFTYNIGINDSVDFIKPTTGVTPLSDANKNNVNEALVSLGFATRNIDSNPGTYTLNPDKISAALGVFNCTFEGISIKDVSNGSSRSFTISLIATPNNNYYWEDGTNTSKELSFTVNLTAS